MKVRHIKPLLFLGSFLLVLQLLIADEKPQNTLTWDKDVFPILVRHCGGCHSSMWNYYSGTEVLRYDTVKSLIEKGTFERVLFTEKTMPPPAKRQLADSLHLDSSLGVIKQWIQLGAPK
jgi:hypothetical protein